jgi:hypothetical protein
MTWYLQLLSWASIHKYASEIVVANEFHHLNFTCEERLQGTVTAQDQNFVNESSGEQI